MGKREEEASRKVLAGEKIEVHTSHSLVDFFLRPYRAYQQKRKEAKIRKNLFKDLQGE